MIYLFLLLAGRFINRCLSFCILWLLTTYLYTLSLRVLFATDAMALFATNVACVYLLSWVILHEQFVGVRVSTVNGYNNRKSNDRMSPGDVRTDSPSGH